MRNYFVPGDVPWTRPEPDDVFVLVPEAIQTETGDAFVLADTSLPLYTEGS